MDAHVDAVAKTLDKREARSLPMPAGVALGFGGCLMTFATLVGVTILPVVLGEGGAIMVMLALPLAGLLASLGLVGYGIRGLVRKSREKSRAARHPGEPWYADWDWDPTGASGTGTGGGAFLGFVLLGTGCAMFTFLFIVAAVPNKDLPMAAKAVLGVVVGGLDFLLLREVYRSLKAVFGSKAPGQARFRFDAFPFVLGGAFGGRLTAPALAGQSDVVVTLRCLEERYVTSRSSGPRSNTPGLSVGVFQLYETHRTLEGSLAEDAGASVNFPLPDGDMGTRLSVANKETDLPRYWELEVEAKGSDPIRFLVPIYRALP